MKIYSFRLLPLLALTAVIGTSSFAFAAPKDGAARADRAGNAGHTQRNARAGNAARGGGMAEQLNLTDAQKSQLRPILQSARSQREALRANTTLSREQKRAQLETLRTTTQAQIAAILTPAQLQQMSALRAEHHGDRGENGAAGRRTR